jgi:RNA-binding protein 26
MQPVCRPAYIVSFPFRCDADPEALSTYILALLKHNTSEAELRKELASQLEEFLEKGKPTFQEPCPVPRTYATYVPTEGPTFINTLFTALRTKSYLPYTDVAPPSASSSIPSTSTDNGIPIPLDALLEPPTELGKKRPGEYDDRDGRPPKGPRLNNDDRFSRFNGGRGNGDYGMGGDNMMMMNGRNGQRYQTPGRGRGMCRDFFSASSSSFFLSRCQSYLQITGIVLVGRSASSVTGMTRSYPCIQ